jgi:hypothetical protein
LRKTRIRPSSIKAISEFVVPRSIPKSIVARAIGAPCCCGHPSTEDHLSGGGKSASNVYRGFDGLKDTELFRGKIRALLNCEDLDGESFDIALPRAVFDSNINLLKVRSEPFYYGLEARPVRVA